MLHACLPTYPHTYMHTYTHAYGYTLFVYISFCKRMHGDINTKTQNNTHHDTAWQYDVILHSSMSGPKLIFPKPTRSELADASEGRFPKNQTRNPNASNLKP